MEVALVSAIAFVAVMLPPSVLVSMLIWERVKDARVAREDRSGILGQEPTGTDGVRYLTVEDALRAPEGYIGGAFRPPEPTPLAEEPDDRYTPADEALEEILNAR